MFCSSGVEVLWIILNFLLCLEAKPLKSPKIVIVGAGLSGVAAAVELIEGGFENVVILEAENRIGGRIHSVPFANGMIDLGAQWVHGETNNVVYDLVHKYFDFGDTGIEHTAPFFVWSNGKPADQEKCMRLSDVASKILTSYPEMLKSGGTLGDFVTKRYKRTLKSAKFADIQPDLADQMLELYHKEVNVWNGTETWFDISARLNSISDVNTGNQYLTWRDKGYMTVFDYLTKKLPDPSEQIDIESKTILNTKVVNIKQSTKLWSQQVQVETQTGDKIVADHVIFTGSLGVLKNTHQTLFTPRLPLGKIRAIKAMGYGTLEKIFLEFEKPFWPTDQKVWVSYDFLWSREDVKILRGTDKEWLVNVRSFTRVDAMPNTIEAILAGKKMAEFEKFNDRKVINDCMWLLERFLGQTLPKPIDMKRTRWLTNPNFFGTYSYQSYSAELNNVLPKDLAKSLLSFSKKPVILFAGEATDDKFPSNAHGAIASGWRAAKELISYLSKV